MKNRVFMPFRGIEYFWALSLFFSFVGYLSLHCFTVPKKWILIYCTNGSVKKYSTKVSEVLDNFSWCKKLSFFDNISRQIFWSVKFSFLHLLQILSFFKYKIISWALSGHSFAYALSLHFRPVLKDIPALSWQVSWDKLSIRTLTCSLISWTCVKQCLANQPALVVETKLDV